MATTLGVPTLSYLPWACLNYTGIIFAMIWAATGIGIMKITKDSENYEANRGLSLGNGLRERQAQGAFFF